MNYERYFEAVLGTLLSTSNSLKELAGNSGFDPFKFYQGADLSGLDLSNQDLRGLNFERANLINTKLENIEFDIGAFNGANLDPEYSEKIDQFEFYIDDVFSAKRFGLYYFARFRPRSLELAIEKTGLFYGEVAERAAINPQTLRKARRGEVVAGDTADAICVALIEAWDEAKFDDLLGDETELRQPFVQLLDLTPKGSFVHIPRADFREVYRSKIIEEQDLGPVSSSHSFRTSFAIEKWYRENEYHFF